MSRLILSPYYPFILVPHLLVVSEEAALIQVSRSPRAASPEPVNQSPNGSRRSSTSSNYSHSAGLPSRHANSM